MSYATEADLIAWCGMNGDSELTELTDPDNTAIDSAIVAEKLNEADNEINARLAGVTISYPCPPIIVNIACRIARFLLYTTGRPEWIADDFDWAISTLNEIRAGKIVIGPALGPVSYPRIAAREPVFTSTVLDTL